MITPQQIDQVSFKKSSFGGYNMQQVDEFLEPLTEDYVTLYKENALLKSKLRVLAGKLEEYRKGEGSAKTASGTDAQAERDKMLAVAKAQCDKMLKDAAAKAQQITAAAAATAATAAPAPVSGNADALIAAEQARVEEARKAANARIAEIQEQMRACIQALERIKSAAAPAAAPIGAPAAPIAAPVAAPAAAPVAPAFFDAPIAPKQPASFSAPAPVSDSVADEIAHSVEALVGTAEEPAPKPEPRHPVNDTTTSRFANLNLQFGRNYDPTHK